MAATQPAPDTTGFTDMSLNILLLCGGNGAEHEISLISAGFIRDCLQANPDFNVIYACLNKTGLCLEDGSSAELAPGAQLHCASGNIKIDCAVPCLHGTPGETGEIQPFLKACSIPFIGCGAEASMNCFNKVTTKLYLSALNIPNSPYTWLDDHSSDSLEKAQAFFARYQDVYVKAAAQGSSIGCFHVSKAEDLQDSIAEAFGFSDTVLLEKNIVHRELEIAAYETDAGLTVTPPGEIIMPASMFYTYEEKYSKDSGTVTTTEPVGLTDRQVETMRNLAARAFRGLHLRDLSRIDFFLSAEGEILINEINTFPGMTPISMFPKLLAHQGDNMTDFLTACIRRALKRAQEGRY